MSTVLLVFLLLSAATSGILTTNVQFWPLPSVFHINRDCSVVLIQMLIAVESSTCLQRAVKVYLHSLTSCHCKSCINVLLQLQTENQGQVLIFSCITVNPTLSLLLTWIFQLALKLNRPWTKASFPEALDSIQYSMFKIYLICFALYFCSRINNSRIQIFTIEQDRIYAVYVTVRKK